MDFNAVWRKRQACVRCRQLKVRCEYASPTDTTCIRCERSHTACVTSGGKKKGGGAPGAPGAKGAAEPLDYEHMPKDEEKVSPEQAAPAEEMQAKEEHAVYLQRIIRDAQIKLHEIGISPLRRAVAAKLFTWEEAAASLKRFLASPTVWPLIRLLDLPNEIRELDKKWPMVAMVAVSVVQLNSTSKPQAEIQLYFDEMMKSDVEPEGGFDQVLAMSMICQFSLWHKERGLTTLLRFHAAVIALMRKLHALGNFAKERLIMHVGAVTILPYVLISHFSPLSQIAFFYNDVVQNVCESYDMCDSPSSMLPLPAKEIEEAYSPHIITSGPLMEAIICYQRALGEISVATTVDDLKQVVDSALQSIQLLENHTALIQIDFTKSHSDPGVFNTSVPESENLLMTPLRPCYLMAKMKIVRAAANRCIDLRSCFGSETQEVLRTVIEQAASSGGQLFRNFAHIDSQFPFVPTTVYYYVADALKIMQMMRFVAFAGGIAVDVRSDCLLQVVTVKWEDFVRVSTIARQSFMLLFLPLDTANVKIGVLDPKTSSVVGSGDLPEFQVFCVNGLTNAITETRQLTREELLGQIDGVLRQRPGEGTPVVENSTAISFPRALKLLLTDI